jgi:predicted amino acid-binding ACT domain protein
VGIIADVCALLAGQGVNVLDISQTVLQEYFTMIMLVDTAACPSPSWSSAKSWLPTARKRGCPSASSGRHLQRHAQN